MKVLKTVQIKGTKVRVVDDYGLYSVQVKKPFHRRFIRYGMEYVNEDKANLEMLCFIEDWLQDDKKNK